MKLNLEFGGGLELLFDGKKQVSVEVEAVNGQLNVQELLFWVRDNLLLERPEMFLKDQSVRPGILVLVNDADWELTGKLESELTDGDSVIFISTLHGG